MLEKYKKANWFTCDIVEIQVIPLVICLFFLSTNKCILWITFLWLLWVISFMNISNTVWKEWLSPLHFCFTLQHLFQEGDWMDMCTLIFSWLWFFETSEYDYLFTKVYPIYKKHGYMSCLSFVKIKLSYQTFCENPTNFNCFLCHVPLIIHFSEHYNEKVMAECLITHRAELNS